MEEPDRGGAYAHRGVIVHRIAQAEASGTSKRHYSVVKAANMEAHLQFTLAPG